MGGRGGGRILAKVDLKLTVNERGGRGGRENIAEPYEGIRKFSREITRIFRPSFRNFFSRPTYQMVPYFRTCRNFSWKITGDASIMY